jgi:hypothetical protein
VDRLVRAVLARLEGEREFLVFDAAGRQALQRACVAVGCSAQSRALLSHR